MGSTDSKPATPTASEPTGSSAEEKVFLDVPDVAPSAGTATVGQEEGPRTDRTVNLFENGPCSEEYARLNKCGDNFEENAKKGKAAAMESCVSEADLLIQCFNKHPKHFQREKV